MAALDDEQPFCYRKMNEAADYGIYVSAIQNVFRPIFKPPLATPTFKV